MQGIDILCPQCGESHYQTTAKFDYNAFLSAEMIEMKPRYANEGWGNAFSAGDALDAISCPECGSPLLVGNHLKLASKGPQGEDYPVRQPIMELYTDEELEKEWKQRSKVKKKYVCEICGREFAYPVAKAGHMRTHNA